MNDLAAQVKSRVEVLAPEAKHLLLAVSGGADSVALFRTLKDSTYEVKVAHLNHGLRDSAQEDCDFVEKLCIEHDIPFYSERIDVGKIAKEKKWNLEDAARRLRYSFLTRIAKDSEADVIVTAHNQDDQAETVMMQLLRGAAFLKGMPARQKQVIRPLLESSRTEIESYLASLNQEFVTDEMNFDINYRRVWLRQEVLPMLEQDYPNVKVKLAQLAEIQGEQLKHFDEQLTGTKDVNELLEMDIARQRHEIARGLARAHLQPTYQHLESIRSSLNTKNPKRISLTKNKQARIAYGKIYIIDKASEKKLEISHSFSNLESLETVLKSVGIELDIFSNEVDTNKLLEFSNLVLRTREAGDRIQLEVGTKKLSDIFINKKILKEDRDTIVLIASHNEVLWVEDVCVDKRVKNTLFKSRQDIDCAFMQVALEQAKQAAKLGELPVGAVLVHNGEVIAKAHNLTEELKDPSAHAELLVLREGAKVLQNWRLSETTLYVTLEPCVMCFGAMLQAHLPKVVYAASNTLEGAHGGVTDLQQHAWKRQINVQSGILAKESEILLKEFFKSRRK